MIKTTIKQIILDKLCIACRKTVEPDVDTLDGYNSANYKASVDHFERLMKTRRQRRTMVTGILAQVARARWQPSSIDAALTEIERLCKDRGER